jgi:hypothetical protein
MTVISLLLLSFFSPQEEIIDSQATFRIKQIENRTVSNKEQHVSFETYDHTGIDDVYLILSGTYGTVVLESEFVDLVPYFFIPESFTKHAGIVTYTLVQNEKPIQEGTFKLFANTQNLGAIETYLGPRSIIANIRDYTMLVSIPTDTLDNLLPDSTQIALKTQFKTAITTTEHTLNSGFAWKRISSPLQTGRLSTGSTLGSSASKELIVDIFPDLAQEFSIRAVSNHNYADGNEIISFETTQIKDAHGNIMTDGMQVTFYIRNDTGAFWQIQTTTVNGYAFAKALHPQSPSNWQVTAAIAGITQSPEISTTFTPIIETIPVTMRKNRQIVVGPLTSYLGQWVQDGIDVSLHIHGTTYDALTKNGEVQFHLKAEDYPKGAYTFTIQTLGLEATHKITVE